MSEMVQAPPRETVSSGRLWFGLLGAAVAWVIAGLLDVVLAWLACIGGDAGSAFFTPTGMRVALGVITFLMLAVDVAAGLVAFQNWRTLSQQQDIMEAEARPRPEYMGLFGVIVSTTLGVGIIWFVLPIYIISMCVRAH
jgi:hypothetical protein